MKKKHYNEVCEVYKAKKSDIAKKKLLPATRVANAIYKLFS